MTSLKYAVKVRFQENIDGSTRDVNEDLKVSYLRTPVVTLTKTLTLNSMQAIPNLEIANRAKNHIMSKHPNSFNFRLVSIDLLD